MFKIKKEKRTYPLLPQYSVVKYFGNKAIAFYKYQGPTGGAKYSIFEYHPLDEWVNTKKSVTMPGTAIDIEKAYECYIQLEEAAKRVKGNLIEKKQKYPILSVLRNNGGIGGAVVT